MQYNIQKESFIKKNYIPILITLGFFFAISYIAFFHYEFVFNSDGLIYLRYGEQILSGDGENVLINNALMGGPVIYATVDKFVNDGFLTLKLFSVFGATGVVFISYFVIKNIFNKKIAILGQLLIVFSPALQARAVLATNELLALILIVSSFYFLTKNNLKKTDIIISAILIGFALDIRFQAVAIFVSVIIFLVIKKSNIRQKLIEIILFSVVIFLLMIPVFAYNYYVHDSFLDGWNTDFENALDSSQSNVDNFAQNNINNSNNNILNSDKINNYFYNIFYHNPNLVFNFHGQNAISMIPIIPFLGIFPILGGFIYLIHNKINKKLVLQSLIIGAIVSIIIFIFGDLRIHFFAIMIIPIIFLGIVNVRKLEKNLLFMLIIPVVCFAMLSQIDLDRADHLFSIWITFSILTAVIVIDGTKSVFTKLNFSENKILGITITIIILILLSNVLFSYKSFDILLYDSEFSNIDSEIRKIFDGKDNLDQIGYEAKIIGEILAEEDDIENKYVMARSGNYSYYANSKHLHSYFHEGIKGDSLTNYVTRQNWSDGDLKISNIQSHPSDRYDRIHPMVDYIVYSKYDLDTMPENRKENNQTLDLLKLIEPANRIIPDNFELLYKSDKTETVVYKINWDE
tara:strand:+ start:769 stop:2658 length:1890 start_codon:yes stop_codon:yes gene_type:complete